MEAASTSTWQDLPPARSPAVESALASLIDVHGSALFMQAGRLRRLLEAAAPGSERHIAVVIVALSAEVPQRLRSAKRDATLPTSLQRLVQYLREHASLDGAWATWAVAVWAHALRLPTTGLDIVIEPADPPPRAGNTVVGSRDAPIPARPAQRPDHASRPPANDGDRAIEPAFFVEPLFPEERPAPVARPQIEPSRPPASITEPKAPVDSDAAGPRASRFVRSVPVAIGLVAIGLAVGLAAGLAVNTRNWSSAPAAATREPPSAPAVVAEPSRKDPSTPTPSVGPVIEPPPAAAAPTTDSAATPTTEPDGPRSETTTASIEAGDTPSRARAAPVATASNACPKNACGTVVSTREISTDGFVYEMVVRMDDRQTRRFAARYRLETGSRVRMNGDRFVPIAAARP